MNRLQFNPGVLSIDRSFPFVNLAKHGQEWASIATNERPNPGFLDANGYMTDFSESGVKHFIQVPTQAQRPGKLVLRASGDGTMVVSAGFTAGSGNLTSSSGAIRYEFLPDSDVSAVTLQIPSRGTGYINSHALIHIDDENDYVNNGKRINTQFKNRVAEAGFTTIRFLNWQSANSSVVCHISELAGLGAYSYGPGIPILGTFKGTTGKTSNNFTLSGIPATPTDKYKIQFIFGQTGNSTSTLNGIPLRNAWGGSLIVPWGDDWSPVAGKHAAAVYDIYLNCWLLQGGSTLTGDVRGLGGALGIDAMIQICNECQLHPWSHIPHLAVDPLTDMTADMAAKFISDLDPDLIPRYELSNEVWNIALGFFQTRYAWEREKLRNGLTGDTPDNDEIDEWYGRGVAQIGEALNTAYGGDRTKYEMVCMTQAIFTSRPKRLTSPRWVTENSGNTAKAAKNFVTAGGWANYWNPHAQIGSSGTDIDAMVTEYHAATDARKLELVAELINDNLFTRGGAYGATLQAYHASHVVWMTAQGIIRYFCYEGGLSTDYSSFMASSLKDQFYRASKWCPDLVRWTLIGFRYCKQNNILEPSVFELSGPGSCWAVLEDQSTAESSIYAPETPQWTAFKLYKDGRFRIKATGV